MRSYERLQMVLNLVCNNTVLSLIHVEVLVLIKHGSLKDTK